jgi:nucleotide-binding universal stress UspA family protein
MALNFALDMAKTYRAEVRAVFVVALGDVASDVEIEAVVEESKRKHHDLFKEPHKMANNAGIQLTTTILYGHTEYQILYEAEKFGADTIVIGHHSKSQWTRWITGSITQTILDNAQCTVIVVKQDHHSK